MKIDKHNMNINGSLSDKDTINKLFSIGYLLQSNADFPGFNELIDKVLSIYRVHAVFSYLGYNGDCIYANAQKLVWRDDKFANFKTGKNVQIIKHNLSTKQGGSNKHPSVAYVGAEVELEFISYGLPFVDKVEGWSIQILGLEKIGDII